MSRIQTVHPQTATGDARVLLEAVQTRLGVTPNFIRVLAHAPKALEGFLGLYTAQGGFSLDKATQERIALVVAEGNGCEYCLSAHTAIGRKAGLGEDEMVLNRSGSSRDPRAAAIVAFARAINKNLGEVSETEFQAARAAGLSDAEIVETIGVVALNIYTNLIGKVTGVDIDFPKALPLPAAAQAAA